MEVEVEVEVEVEGREKVPARELLRHRHRTAYRCSRDGGRPLPRTIPTCHRQLRGPDIAQPHSMQTQLATRTYCNSRWTHCNTKTVYITCRLVSPSQRWQLVPASSADMTVGRLYAACAACGNAACCKLHMLL